MRHMIVKLINWVEAPGWSTHSRQPPLHQLLLQRRTLEPRQVLRRVGKAIFEANGNEDAHARHDWRSLALEGNAKKQGTHH